MRKFAASLVAVIGLFAAANVAVSQGVPISQLPPAKPINGSELVAIAQTNNGAAYTYKLPLGSVSAQKATTNAALQALATNTGTVVIRTGFYVSGDAPPMFYAASTSPCSLNSGAGDNGSQVSSADGKCWIWIPPSTGADVREFGAVPDATWAMFDYTQSGTTLTVSNVSGVVTVGQTIPALGETITGGSGTTWTVSASASHPAPSGTWLISGNTLTTTGNPALSQGSLISGAGVASNTVVVSGSGNSWTLNRSQTVAAEAMTATNYAYAYSGTDNAAAIQAAMNTGLSVVIGGNCVGPGPFSSESQAYGIASPVVMNQAQQDIRANCAQINALHSFQPTTFTASASGTTLTVTSVSPGQTIYGHSQLTDASGQIVNNIMRFQQSGTPGGAGVYMLTEPVTVSSETMTAIAPLVDMEGAGQVAHTLWLDGGQQIGAMASGLYMGNGQQTVDHPIIWHVADKALNMSGTSGDQRVFDPYITEWNMSSERLSKIDSLFTGDGIYCLGRADDKVIGGIIRWTGTNIHLSTGCGTNYFLGMHIYGGRPGGPARATPVNVLIDADAGGSNFWDQLYLDDGMVQEFSTGDTFRNVFPLTSTSASSFPAFMQTYAAGQKSAPFNVSFATVPSVSPSQFSYPVYQNVANPNPVVVTAAAGNGTAITYTVAAWTQNQPQPAVNGFITVTGMTPGTLNCTQCAVTGSTATTVSVASAVTDTGTGFGAVGGDWPATVELANAVVPAVGASLQHLGSEVNTYVANNGVQCHTDLTTVNLLIGCGSGNVTTLTFGDEAVAAKIHSDGSGNLFFKMSSVDKWEFVSNGALRPVADNSTNLGSTTNHMADVFSFNYNIAAQPFSSLAACASGTAGTVAFISDGPASPTWHQTVSAGGGSTKMFVGCNGSNWTVANY